MKRGYIFLLLYELVIFIVLFFNSFISGMLGNYKMFIFLLVIIISFKFTLGLEKDRHTCTKDIIMEEIIFFLVFFILYYLLGLVIGFAKIDNYYNMYSLIHIILPIVLGIIAKEYLRYNMMIKSQPKKILYVITTLLFIFMDISSGIRMNLHGSNYEIFLLLAITVFPAISTNIFGSYVTLKSGYKPVILYRLVAELFLYLIPIVPNPNQYFYSVIWLVLPMILCYRLYLIFEKAQDQDIPRDYNKKRVSLLIIPLLVVLFLVYITSGYFHYHAIVIGSGSMEKAIYKGDVVIIEKVKWQDRKKIPKGQVVAFKYGERIIVHRVVEKIDYKNETYFYTKGDANNNRDSWTVTEDMIIGVVNIKIPYIGLPSVWLRNL